MGANNVIFDTDFYARIYIKNPANDNEKIELKLSSKYKEEFKMKHLSNPSFLNHHLFFTVCDTTFSCEIYRGKISGIKLVEIKKLNRNINNTVSNNTQPHAVVEENDTVLYFVSDREHGFGGLDIWRAKKEGFGFGQPVNLGNIINTPDDEITPFFDVKSHQLFFSSNWHIGFGGYDVFKSEKQGIHFKSPENLGKPINSSYNDYYFYPFKEKAFVSSNRPKGNIDSEDNCCNDLYEVDYIREQLAEKDKIDKINTAEAKVNEEVLNKFLPLSLYFHNDSPSSSSNDTTTNSDFTALASEYLSLISEYENKYISSLSPEKQESELFALRQFFENKISYGLDQLEEITPLLLKELQKGNQIELSVRGYASSLSTSEYNLKLATRRIQSLINYLKMAESGAFLPYLQSKSLVINKLPLGDYAVSQVQDESNKLAAIYSVDAAIERKIEIIALKSSNNSQLNETEQPRLEIPKDKFSAIYKKGNSVKRGFLLKNTGNDTLKIYQIVADEKVVRCNPIKYITKGNSARIEVEVFTGQLEGVQTIELLLITNDPKDNLRKIEIELRPID